MCTPDGSFTRCLNRRTVAEIQGNVVKQGKRNAVSRLLHSKHGKGAFAAWKQDLNRILHVFNVRSESALFGGC